MSDINETTSGTQVPENKSYIAGIGLKDSTGSIIEDTIPLVVDYRNVIVDFGEKTKRLDDILFGRYNSAGQQIGLYCTASSTENAQFDPQKNSFFQFWRDAEQKWNQRIESYGAVYAPFKIDKEAGKVTRNTDEISDISKLSQYSFEIGRNPITDTNALLNIGIGGGNTQQSGLKYIYDSSKVAGFLELTGKSTSEREYPTLRFRNGGGFGVSNNEKKYFLVWKPDSSGDIALSPNTADALYLGTRDYRFKQTWTNKLNDFDVHEEAFEGGGKASSLMSSEWLAGTKNGQDKYYLRIFSSNTWAGSNIDTTEAIVINKITGQNKITDVEGVWRVRPSGDMLCRNLEVKDNIFIGETKIDNTRLQTNYLTVNQSATLSGVSLQEGNIFHFDSNTQTSGPIESINAKKAAIETATIGTATIGTEGSICNWKLYKDGNEADFSYSIGFESQSYKMGSRDTSYLRIKSQSLYQGNPAVTTIMELMRRRDNKALWFVRPTGEMGCESLSLNFPDGTPNVITDQLQSASVPLKLEYEWQERINQGAEETIHLYGYDISLCAYFGDQREVLASHFITVRATTERR